MKRGFTLIETIIAISVMAIGVVGIYALAPPIMRVVSINSNRFVATQLAVEGVEIVRNFRDTNWLKEIAWDNDLNACGGGRGVIGCEIDYNDSSPRRRSQDRFLSIDSQGFYNYESGRHTKFRRIIVVTPQGEQGESLIVKVTVSWLGPGSPVEVEEHLYNWR